MFAIWQYIALIDWRRSAETVEEFVPAAPSPTILDMCVRSAVLLSKSWHICRTDWAGGLTIRTCGYSTELTTSIWLMQTPADQLRTDGWLEETWAVFRLWDLSLSLTCTHTHTYELYIYLLTLTFSAFSPTILTDFPAYSPSLLTNSRFSTV